MIKILILHSILVYAAFFVYSDLKIKQGLDLIVFKITEAQRGKVYERQIANYRKADPCEVYAPLTLGIECGDQNAISTFKRSVQLALNNKLVAVTLPLLSVTDDENKERNGSNNNLKEPEANNNNRSIQLSEVPNIDFWLPARIYAVEGIETNIYFDNAVYADFGKADLSYTVSCVKGQQFERSWTYNPSRLDSGAYSFILSVYYRGELIAFKSDSLFVTTRAAGQGKRNILSCGNSLWAGGEIVDTIKDNYGSDILSLNFVGKVLTNGGNRTEGHSGYTWSDFSTEGRKVYNVKVHDVKLNPGIGHQYSTNGSEFRIVGENIALGNGDIQLIRINGTGIPFTKGGILTKVSGSGDSTLNYSFSNVGSGNPFWNIDFKRIDLKNYLKVNSITLNSSDWATFELGINDMFNYFDTTSAGLAAKKCVMYIESLISQFQKDVPGLRIAILMPSPPANQDAFGVNYGTSQTAWRYWSNLNIYYKYILKNFDTPLQLSKNVYVLGIGNSLDRINNVKKSSVSVNSRNKTTYIRNQNGVHPANSGYAQYADAYYSFLKWYK